MSESDNVFFDPFICFTDTKEVVNEVPLLKVYDILGAEECLLDPEDEWYCASFSGVQI